ncbi:MAG: tRNA pseudouridine(55) synthase [Bacteroidales bacterium]|nr:tRNA pseudouridine(55) synthase [Bacteroidales bacterium]
MQFSRNIEDYPEGIILPIDKPYRWTSADVIRKIKWAAIRHFEKKNLKVGHAGTLDPLATGLLLVCIGPATRRAEELQRSPKEYLAGITFGATTPSYDLEKAPEEFFALPEGFGPGMIEAALPAFIGEQDQIAPLFSAKSVDGVRAYEMARKLYRSTHGQASPLPEGDVSAAGFDMLQKSRITIYGLNLVGCETGTPRNVIADPRFDEAGQMAAMDPTGECTGGRFNDTGEGRIRVAGLGDREYTTALLRVGCSKGTYIRALARDLGETLGTGAFLSSLRRTSNGGFTIADAVSVREAMEMLWQ